MRLPGNPYDSHILYDVDRDYRGVQIDGVQIWKSGQRRGVRRGRKAMIKRRSAIEPAIGHMKSDGKLDRKLLKAPLGDAMHAILCGVVPTGG